MDTPIAVDVADASKRFRQLRDRRTTFKERIVRGRPTKVEEFWALREVSLQVPRGSVFGLVGPNGSGKSTLLKLIGRIYRPTSGSIHTDGRVAALIELGAGFHPDMTGRENIRLNGSILGLSRKEIDAATGEIIDFSGLGDFIDEPVKHYSSGMYVRLGFSVAVHMRPDVLLIDEVIAVGDEDFQRRCFDHLYQLRRSGRTIILVSHSLGLVESLCDEAAWLERGRVVAAGPAPQVVARYLGAVNAAEVSTRSGHALDDGAGRPGSGLVRLNRVALVDGDGRPVPHGLAGEAVRIRLWLRAAAPVEQATLALAFYHESGVLVGGISSRTSAGAPAVLEGDAILDVELPACPLNPGHYRVRATIADRSGSHTIDDWEDALELVVRAGPGPQRPGLVALPGTFATPVAPGRSTP